MAFNVREIFQALDDAAVDYVVVGGLAVIMHGHLRATSDLDLAIGLEPDNCSRGMKALASVGVRPRLPVTLQEFADPERRSDWVENHNMLVFQLFDPSNVERSVDVFEREPIAMSELSAKAVVRDLDGVPVRVASIRHLIELKQVAGRPLDLDDIEALREIARDTGEESA